MSRAEPMGRAEAQVLAARICTAAGLAAQSQCALLDLIGEFDAGGAVGWWQDIKSVAHWLAWTCSMSPGTAREHVRVARALRRMPTVAATFREGRLSYSKVREVTRVVGVIDEARLCELALTATASQLGRMLTGYRGASGRRIQGEREREFRWSERESGLVDVRIRLPKEEAAVVLAAVNAAKDHHDTPPDDTPPHDASTHDATTDGATLAGEGDRVDATPAYGLVDAVVDLARDYLTSMPADRSGEDRATVLVHVAADHLAPSPATAEISPGSARAARAGIEGADVPAGTSPEPTPPVPEPTCQVPEPTCQVQGLGGIEPETARRMACDCDLLGAVIDAHGDVLALGRTRRLVSRPLRRALMIRDHGMCQYPGCHQTRHLKAHHIIHWATGGTTDLGNLVLLCQFHHTAVHEGHMTITRRSTPDPIAEPAPGRYWEFRMPDDTDPQPWWTADALAHHLARHTQRHRAKPHADGTEPPADGPESPADGPESPAAEADRHARHLTARITAVDHWDHPDAARIRPGWAGEPFDLQACVEALFSMELPDTHPHHLAA